MKKRLLERAEREVGVGHWLTDLVNELSVSPDTPLSPKFHFDRVTEALNELKENNSEIFEGVFFSPEEDKQVDVKYEDLSDAELVQAMETWEENEMENAFDSWDYGYSLTDEVSESSESRHFEFIRCLPF